MSSSCCSLFAATRPPKLRILSSGSAKEEQQSLSAAEEVQGRASSLRNGAVSDRAWLRQARLQGVMARRSQPCALQSPTPLPPHCRTEDSIPKPNTIPHFPDNPILNSSGPFSELLADQPPTSEPKRPEACAGFGALTLSVRESEARMSNLLVRTTYREPLGALNVERKASNG